jgi:dethiobiotin synthetase
VSAAQTLASEYDCLIVEGAGGCMVPLNRHELMLDLMRALKLPVIIAASPGLGTINHTLLSIRALKAAGIEISGIVFVASKAGEPGFIEEDNAFTIEQFGNVPILGTIPFCPQLRETSPAYSALPVTVAAEIEKIVNRLKMPERERTDVNQIKSDITDFINRKQSVFCPIRDSCVDSNGQRRSE